MLETLTPELVRDEATSLLLIDLGRGENRLGGRGFFLGNKRVLHHCHRYHLLG